MGDGPYASKKSCKDQPLPGEGHGDWSVDLTSHREKTQQVNKKVCVWMHTHTHTCSHTFSHGPTHVYMDPHMFTCSHTFRWSHMFRWSHTCLHGPTHVYMFPHTFTCPHACLHGPTHVYMLPHIYMVLHTHMKEQFSRHIRQHCTLIPERQKARQVRPLVVTAACPRGSCCSAGRGN